MAYIYHLVPESLKGKVLYPLNILKKKYPLIYKKQASKYAGEREKVMKRKIPYLDCLLNDVLHFTPVHPTKITKALKKAGYPTKKLKWFKINANKLDPNKAIIYLFTYKKKESEFMAKDNFRKFNIKNLYKYNEIPKRTIEYYKRELNSGRKPLRFLFIPHVFYKDKLDISNTDIIEA